MNGCTLKMEGEGTSLDNSGRTLVLGEGIDSLRLGIGSTIVGGVIDQRGGNRIFFEENPTTLPDPTFDGVTVIDDLALARSGMRLNLRNGFAIQNGAMRATAPCVVAIGGDCLFDGTMRFDATNQTLNSGPLDGGDGRLTISPASVLSGGNLLIYAPLGGDRTLVNNGLILSDRVGASIVFASHQPLTNNGTLRATNTSSIQFASGAPLTNLSGGVLHGGRYIVDQDSVINLPGAVTTNAGFISITGAGSFISGLNGLASNQGTLELRNHPLGVAPVSGALTNSGVIRLDAGSPLLVVGGFAQTSSGSLELALGPSRPQAYVAITGSTSLGGSVSIALADPGAGAWGDQWTLLTYAAHEGEFATLALPALANPALRWWSAAGPMSYVAGLRAVGDTNHDLVVDFLDLNNVLSAFGQAGTGLIGDADGNGVVDFLDLNWVLGSFGQHAPATVPAPSALALAAAAAFGAGRCRKR